MGRQSSTSTDTKQELCNCTFLDDWAAPVRQVVLSRALLIFSSQMFLKRLWLMVFGALAILCVYICEMAGSWQCNATYVMINPHDRYASSTKPLGNTPKLVHTGCLNVKFVLDVFAR